MVIRLLLPFALAPFTLAQSVIPGGPSGTLGLQGPGGGSAVLVVDAAGGGDFLDLPEAVAAANDGDLVLVEPSATAYSGFRLDGKGLAVVARGSGVHAIVGKVEVENLGVDQFFGLRGFEVELAAASGGVIEVSDVAGTVWIEDCEVHALGLPVTPYSPPAGANDGLMLVDCANVVLTRTSVDGQRASATTFEPRVGLHILRSSVAAFDATLRGPDGADASATLFWGCLDGTSSPQVASLAQAGGMAVRVEDSFFYAQGSSLSGGDGGTGACCQASPRRCGIFSQTGGSGVEVLGASDVQLLDVVTAGGSGGASLMCSLSFFCSSAADGVATLGPVSILSGDVHRLELPALLPLGSSNTLQVEGAEGEEAYAVFSEDSAHFYWPPLQGVQVTRAPVSFVSLGEIPAGGVLQRSLVLPPMALTSGAQRRIVQGLFFAEGGSTNLGGGSLVHLLP